MPVAGSSVRQLGLAGCSTRTGVPIGDGAERKTRANSAFLMPFS